MKENDGHRIRKARLRRRLVYGIGPAVVVAAVAIGRKLTHEAPVTTPSRRTLEDVQREKSHRVPLKRRSKESDTHPQVDDNHAMQLALDAKLHLVDLQVHQDEFAVETSQTSYAGVYGKFCRVDWNLHKEDPSQVPMFRDLVKQSKDCELKWKLNIKKLVSLAKEKESAEGSTTPHPKTLNLTAAVFHESRCGSTLVANALAAMDPIKHRVYSEPAPLATAMMNICGDTFSHCSPSKATAIFKDVVYLMSRSDDPKEERVFFKFQSFLTAFLSIFQSAFPNAPWMFVFRDPVQVMMSHYRDDPSLMLAHCARSRFHPTPETDALIRRHDKNHQSLTAEDHCAVHLASLTEAAVGALHRSNNNHNHDERQLGMAVHYADLPNALYTVLPPFLLGHSLEESSPELVRMRSIASQYSKQGEGDVGVTFENDSQAKEAEATEAVRQAAATFLQESYLQLLDYSSVQEK